MMDISNQHDKDKKSIYQLDRPLSWRKYIFLFLSNWYWFLITIFVAISLAYLKDRYTLPIYKANVNLLIEDEEGTDDIVNEIRSVRRWRRKTDLANEIAKLNSFSLHRRTVDSLAWNIYWTGHGRIARIRPLYKYYPYDIIIDSSSDEWYINQTFYIEPSDERKLRLYNKNGIDTIVNIDEWNNINGWTFNIQRNSNKISYASYSFIVHDRNTIAAMQRAKITYESDEEQGTLIKLSSQGPIPNKEVDYLNALCRNFMYTGLERKRIAAENMLEFVENQIKIIQDSLQRTERQMLNYRLNMNVVDLSEEMKQAYYKLQGLYERKTQLILKRKYYEYLDNYINEKNDPQAIIAPILVDANDQLLIEQVQNLQRLYEEREMLTFSASVENPSLVQLNSRIYTTTNKIHEILNGLIQNNELTQDQIDIEEQRINKQLMQLPISEQELLNIQRKYDVNNQFYTFLLERKAEAGIQRASTISNVRILDEAKLFLIEKTGTRSSIIYLLAIIIGLLIPSSIIILNDYLDLKIKDKNDVTDHTNLPIIGVVAHEVSGVDIPVLAKPKSAFTESFRQIRTNLQYILREPKQNVIMITSTVSGEGKTFIALNLAGILAISNKKVLLGGFDLRRPTLHKIFNTPNDQGISTYLAGQHNFTSIIRSTSLSNLDIINAGPIPPNPAELLETSGLEILIAEMKEIYDYIILDTPPIAMVIDAIVLSRFTSAIIFVVRQNFSHKPVINLINKYTIDKQLKGVSLLINDVNFSRILGYSNYYGYGYEYSYGYAYGYGDKYYSDIEKS